MSVGETETVEISITSSTDHPNDFHEQVIALLPKLRAQANALTRNRTFADDLVQEAVCNALAAQNSFIPGTNFAAWMHRILRNRFISDIRRRRETTDIDDVAGSFLACEGSQEDVVTLRNLDAAMAELPAEQREALVMVSVHGASYEHLSEITGCAVGTMKSRVFRARRQLEIALLGEERSAGMRKTPARGRQQDAINLLFQR